MKLVRFFAFIYVLVLLALPIQVKAGIDDDYLQPDQIKITPYSKEEIPKYVEKAEQQKDPEAQYVIGYMYYYGIGLQENKPKGRKLVEAAANAELSDALILVSDIYQDSGDAKLSTDALFKAAKKKNPKAWYRLGLRYEYGYGVFQDIEKSRKWYEAADAAGVVNAKIKLGMFYLYGKGVPKDIPKAIGYFEEAEALVAEESKLRFTLLIADLYAQMASDKKMEAASMKWRLKAAELGHRKSQYLLAEAYFSGAGVKQDYAEAVRWYTKTAENGNTDSMTRLGYIYSNGIGASVDYTKATDWYRRAADEGSAEAAWAMGNMYMGGHGVTKDVNEANIWFARSERLKKNEKPMFEEEY